MQEPKLFHGFFDKQTVELARLYYKTLIHDNLESIVNMSLEFGDVRQVDDKSLDTDFQRLVLGNRQIFSRSIATYVREFLEKEYDLKLILGNLLPILNLPRSYVSYHSDKPSMGDYTCVANMFLEGQESVEYYINDNVYHVREGDLIVFPYNALHGVKALNDKSFRLNLAIMFYDAEIPITEEIRRLRDEQLSLPGFKVSESFNGDLNTLISLEE